MEYKKQLKKWAARRENIVRMREVEKQTFGEIALKLRCSPQNARILYLKEKKENGTDSSTG